MTTYKEDVEILNPQHRSKNLYIQKESLSMHSAHTQTKHAKHV